MSLIGAALIAGGLSAAGSVGSTALSNWLSGKNSKKAAERQYGYYLQSLVDGPSKQVEGLRKAGLNPVLATGLGATSAQQTVQAPMINAGNAVESALDGAVKTSALAEKKNAIKNADNEADAIKAETDAIEAESSARQTQARLAEIEADASICALTGEIAIAKPDIPGYEHPYESKEFKRFVEQLRNKVDWDAKMFSDENFMYQKGLEAIHGLRDGFSAYDSFRGSRKTYHNTYNFNTGSRHKR